jgi:chromosome segregation ATPase
LQNRNDELVRVKAELDRIHDRFNQLESFAVQAENATRGEVERMRSEFQAQLASLQAELSQKEWALVERQASANGSEQDLRQQIESLRSQLSEQKSVDQQSISKSAISAAQLERLASLESTLNATATGMAPLSDESSQRRWRSRFVAKRRWKV